MLKVFVYRLVLKLFDSKAQRRPQVILTLPVVHDFWIKEKDFKKEFTHNFYPIKHFKSGYN